MSITRGVLAQSPEPEAHDKVLDNNPDRIGIWKCWFMRRGENRSTRRKTSRSKDENQQQTRPLRGRPAWEVNAQPLHHPCSPIKRARPLAASKTGVLLQVTKSIVFVLFSTFLWLGLVWSCFLFFSFFCFFC